MKLKEVILESEEQQLDELTAADVGRGVGKVAGGIGAVAGGVKGAWQAAKKGFEKGRATVAGEVPADTGAGAAPAGLNPQASGAPAAGGAATGGGAPAAAAAGASKETANLQGQVDKLAAQLKDLEGRLKQSQQKDKATAGAAKAAPQPNPAAGAQQQAAPGAKPAGAAPGAQQAPGANAQAGSNGASYGQGTAPQGAAGAAPKKKWDTSNATDVTPKAAPALGAPAAAAPAADSPEMIGRNKGLAKANQAAPALPAPTAAAPAAEPAAQTPAIAPQAPAGRAQGGGKVAGQQSQTPRAIQKRQARLAAKGEPAKAAPASQSQIDADRERIMGVTSDSVIRTQPSLAETLAARVEQHKRKMFESSLAKGDFRVFK